MEIFIKYSIFLPVPTVSEEHQCSICPSLHTIWTLTAAPMEGILIKRLSPFTVQNTPFVDNFMLDGETMEAHLSLLHFDSSNRRLAQHTKIVDPAMLVPSHSSSSESKIYLF